MTTRLAVLGSPIAHSKSPALHRAAYRALGLDWQYDAIEVRSGELESFLAGLGPEWRGLSLTMPLKREVMPLLRHVDTMAGIVSGANTVRFDKDGLAGFNTDVGGIEDAFREAGIDRLGHVQILGAGATAASALVAARGLGAQSAWVSARDPDRARAMKAYETVGIEMSIGGIGDPSERTPDAVISTLPPGANAGMVFSEAVRRNAVLFDVAYGHGEGILPGAWHEAGGTVITGLHMLLHQAVRQIRIFTGGDGITPLEREDEVLAAMRAAVAL